MNDYIDNKVKEAWAVLILERISRIPEEEELKNIITFSSEFLDNEKKILKFENKYIFLFGKALSKVVLIIIITTIMVGTITVYAVYRATLVEKIFENNSDITADFGDIEIVEKESKVIFLPSHLPDNYVLYDTVEAEDVFVHTYSDDLGKRIHIKQYDSSMTYNVDTQDTIQEKALVNNAEVIYISRNGSGLLIWIREEYLFILDSDSEEVDKEEMIKIAESLK